MLKGLSANYANGRENFNAKHQGSGAEVGDQKSEVSSQKSDVKGRSTESGRRKYRTFNPAMRDRTPNADELKKQIKGQDFCATNHRSSIAGFRLATRASGHKRSQFSQNCLREKGQYGE